MHKLILLVLACFYGVFTSYVCQEYSKDYFNILDSISYTQLNLDLSWLTFLYHIQGNSLLLVIFDIAKLEPDIAVFTLFAVASSLRFYYTFKNNSFWNALFLMWAFYWMLDWNQSRFSFVFFLSYLIPSNIKYLLPFLHFMVGAKILIDKISVQFSLIFSIGFVVFIFLFSTFFTEFWARYFLGSTDSFPIYFIAYFFFVIIMLYFHDENYRRIHLNILLAFISVFLLLVLKGMSPVYLGRIVEFFLLKSSYDLFIKNYKTTKYIIVSRLILFLVGFYQTITVTGNVWRIFY